LSESELSHSQKPLLSFYVKRQICEKLVPALIAAAPAAATFTALFPMKRILDPGPKIQEAFYYI
jgi:hypothetical protein